VDKLEAELEGNKRLIRELEFSKQKAILCYQEAKGRHTTELQNASFRFSQMKKSYKEQLKKDRNAVKTKLIATINKM
jgi:hypothetical protein